MEKFNFTRHVPFYKVLAYIRSLEKEIVDLRQLISHWQNNLKVWQENLRHASSKVDQIECEKNALQKENSVLKSQLIIFQLLIVTQDMFAEREAQLAKNKEREICDRQLDKIGISSTNIHIFSESLLTVMRAINNKEVIEGINILEEIRKDSFRFYTIDQPILSLEMSNALAKIAKSLRKTSPKFMESGRKKRTENADSFAKIIHDIINKVRIEEKVSSYKDTAKALNDRGISTYLEGEWRPSTLSDINKRFIKLGLSPLSTQPK